MVLSLQSKIRLGLLSISVLWPLSGYSFDESRVWLPRSYQTLYLPLLEATAAAEALERCVTVLDSTLDLEQSAPDHPIFRVLCRQDSGRSYVEMVDGVTFETLTTRIVPEPTPTPEERERIEQQRRAERLAAEEKRKRDTWQACQGLLRHKTRLMVAPVWLSELESPKPSHFSEDKVEYRVDFDAENVWGESLRYQAVCTAEAGGEPKMDIIRRKS